MVMKYTYKGITIESEIKRIGLTLTLSVKHIIQLHYGHTPMALQVRGLDRIATSVKEKL